MPSAVFRYKGQGRMKAFETYIDLCETVLNKHHKIIQKEKVRVNI